MSRGSNVAAHVVVIISHLFVPLALPKVLSFENIQIKFDILLIYSYHWLCRRYLRSE